MTNLEIMLTKSGTLKLEKLDIQPIKIWFKMVKIKLK